jgi:hypothetical protein
MAKKKGKAKTSGASTARQPRRSTVTPSKTVAEDSESDHADTIDQPIPPLGLGTFDNEDDLYIDEEQEIVYLREEEEEGEDGEEEEEEEEDELAGSDSGSSSDNSLPPLKIIIPLKRNKPDVPNCSGVY